MTAGKGALHGRRIGYARVNSLDQNPERHLEDVPVDGLLTEKASGKDAKRPEADALLPCMSEPTSPNIRRAVVDDVPLISCLLQACYVWLSDQEQLSDGQRRFLLAPRRHYPAFASKLHQGYGV